MYSLVWFGGFVFFFFKQKTAYEMRISDWSSDVCSSDLLPAGQRATGARREDWAIDTGLDVAYEVDLFGRVSRGVEAASGDVDAARADADAARVLVGADTTRAYADAASAAARLRSAERRVGKERVTKCEARGQAAAYKQK